MHNILFVCTANIFRSRFAEEVFNFLAIKEKIPTRAFSAGLKKIIKLTEVIMEKEIEKKKKENIILKKYTDLL